MPRALLSVSDKTLLVDFARSLEQLGWSLLASGSTAKTLRDANITVQEVADYTQSPEILGGRVKTLHPAIHGGLLARPTQEDHAELTLRGWDYIDLTVVNLYPFEQKNTIENIDIGGVALIRAAAKNYERVTVICEPADYPRILAALQNGSVPENLRKELAAKAFAHTSRYDTAITRFLNPAGATSGSPLQLYPIQTLRYGENPHQRSTLYSLDPNITTPLDGKLLQGKELSYNNVLDLDAAWRTVSQFEKPTVAIIKHLSPCGIASADTIEKAYQAALASDPISAFGGIIASNRIFDAATVDALGSLFVECIAAPSFSPEALEKLAARTRCRLLELPEFVSTSMQEWRSVQHGLLCQTRDIGDPENTTEWRVVSKREPTESEWLALKFAWKASQPVRSNAIVLAVGEATVGIGGGQPNRIDCVRTAVQQAGVQAAQSVMASDAFFPFADCIELAAQHGITAVIHPGGSLRDADVINAADTAGMAMVMTGVRHFRH
jgi:phosphoribosylaminoimidazolecarboxamide formyltransferase/IMP cyclohydrolase